MKTTPISKMNRKFIFNEMSNKDFFFCITLILFRFDVLIIETKSIVDKKPRLNQYLEFNK